MNVELSLDFGTYSGELKKIEPIQYYRVPHDKERLNDGSYGGDGYWGGQVRDRAKIKPIPEVFRLYPDQTTGLECKWIKWWWKGNPMLDREHFELLLDNRWMLCNSTGWPGRYNCLTGENPREADPSFHAAIINGGATVTGTVIGNKLYLNTLITSDPVPSDPNWWENNKEKWYWATTVASSGNITYTTFAGIDGKRQNLRIPILTGERVYIPLRELDKLPLGYFPPSPMWRP